MTTPKESPENSQPIENEFSLQYEQLKESKSSALWENFRQGRMLKRIVNHPIGRRAAITGLVGGSIAAGIGIDRLLAGKGQSAESPQPFYLDETKLIQLGFEKFNVDHIDSPQVNDLNIAFVHPYGGELTLTELSQTATHSNHAQVNINFIPQRIDDRDKSTNDPKGKLKEGINIISFDRRLPERTIPFAVSLPENLESDNLQLYLLRIGQKSMTIDGFLDFSDLQMQAVGEMYVESPQPNDPPGFIRYGSRTAKLEGQLILVFGRKH